MNGLRAELAVLLGQAAASRPPALRRSLRAEWLYASDLPAACSEEALEEALERVRAAGWEAEADGGWVQFRKTIDAPPKGWFDGAFGKEAACCLSLLRRHPDPGGEAEQEPQLLLVKAGEEGEKAYEAACGQLHRAWAERLRKGRKLPRISRKYFGA